MVGGVCVCGRCVGVWCVCEMCGGVGGGVVCVCVCVCVMCGRVGWGVVCVCVCVCARVCGVFDPQETWIHLDPP